MSVARLLGGLAVGLALLPCAAAGQRPTTPPDEQAGSVPDSLRPGGRPLSLEEALQLGQQESEGVEIAAAGLAGAHGHRKQARSQYFPQIGASAGYVRTLASQFSDLGGVGEADTTAAGFDFTQTGFGAANQWSVGLDLAQNIFTGGRIQAQVRAASARVRSAEIDVSSQRAQTALDVTGAYFDAVLADQLVAIARESLEQTERVLTQTRLGRQVGEQSEFELIRAQVTRDNQRPTLIQALAGRDVAYLRLKQLLGLPIDDDLDLTTRIDDAPDTLGASLARAAVATAGVRPPDEAAAPFVDSVGTPLADTAVAARATVRQLGESLEVQEAQIDIARAQRLPSVALVSGYQRLYFPTQLFPVLEDARQNWTVGVQASVPIFTGGRIGGDEAVARAARDQARAELERARKLTALDARVAIDQLREADATYDAIRGTAEQAARAYEIDQVRYREGISSQTDLTQTRLLLEQARANQARAARDRAVARVRLALLRDLPLQSGSLGAANGPLAAAASAQAALAAQQTEAQRVTTSPISAGGIR